jgi:oxygen-independent coproporphyrinogen-3 oxidase
VDTAELLSTTLPPPASTGIPCSAYLHIPFCRRRCYYCDFPVSVVGDRKNGDNSGTIQHYVEVLLQEISITPAFCQPLETVFFGGGTPSLLSVSQLGRILDALHRQFGIAAGAEISIEIDPGTFTLEQLQGYCSAGVNRISVGVQAFQDELLHLCGRSHTVSDIYAAIDLLRRAGADNFSLDLISGLPHQTLEQWRASLEAAVALAPAHISTYDLIVEPKTPFSRYYQPGVQPLPSDETAAQMYRLAQQVLTRAGYEHYEISNYAKPGYQCRHNRVYWENRPYYGFGMGATSYVGGHRFTRPRKTWEYSEWVQSQAERRSPQPPLKRGAVETAMEDAGTSDSDILLETLMLGLRLAEGVSLSAFAEQFGTCTLQQICKCLQPYCRQGWVEIVGGDGVPVAASDCHQLPAEGRLRLSDPEGFLFSNTILAALFGELS